MLHRTRHLFMRQQTSVINAIRAHLAEFGIVAPVGRNAVEQLLDVAADVSDKRLPENARACLLALGAQLRTLKAQILNFDRQIMACHRSKEASKRLDEIPGVGPALATALVASVADPKAFRSGRDFSAWVGLVPKQNSSGGKDRLGSISKQGDRYLRSLFTAGALAQLTTVIVNPGHHDAPWSHWACPAARNPQLAHRVVFNPMASIWNKLFTGEAGDGVPPVTSVGPEWNRTEKKVLGEGAGQISRMVQGVAARPPCRFSYRVRPCAKTEKCATFRASRNSSLI
jgi:hypothetical protein